MNNPKTTVIGVLTIVAAVANAVLTYMTDGTVPDMAALTVAISAGIGLIHAKDDNKA